MPVFDQYLFFACASVALTLARYGTYLYSIYQKKTKPHLFSWLLWGLVVGIGALVQFSLDGGLSAWNLAFISISCLLIAVLSFFIGTRDYSKSDWIALCACLLAIPFWQMTQNPIATLVLIVIIDLLTYFPTVRKSFYAPHTEPPISYGLAGLRYFLILFTIPEPTWQTVLYPFFLMLTDWGFAIYIVIRRAQLGYPLHEYAQVQQ